MGQGTGPEMEQGTGPEMELATVPATSGEEEPAVSARDDLIRLATVNIDCPDAWLLSEFYRKLLGWEQGWRDEDFVIIRDPRGGTGLSFQTEPAYVAPVWPDESGRPGKSMHLDFLVSDLPRAEALALALVAVRAPQQFLEEEGVVVYFDPAGHPFCLFIDLIP